MKHINIAVRIRPLNNDEIQAGERIGLHQNGCELQMLNDAVAGKNVTIFAYGQTGSGKTYTMEGLMKESAEYLFHQIMGAQDREFLLKMSAVEVYNEAIHDLLQSNHQDALNSRIELGDTKAGKMIMKGATEESLLSSSHLQRMLARVQINRKVRETCFNVQSSRSHQIVTIMLESRRSSTSPKPASDSAQLTTKVAGLLPDSSTMHSTITFVDLAGSEPAASHISDAARIKYASTGPLPDDKQRKLESAKINQSLLTLKRVITMLADKQGGKGTATHVPFRDSNLTRLLKPNLGGNSNTAMIATVSMALSAVENTKSTLQFVELAEKVKMTPKVNMVANSESRIRQLEEEVRALRNQLLEAELQKQLHKDRAPVAVGIIAGDERTNVENDVVGARLQLENDTLKQDKEALARKIAGLERLVLNAPPVWAPDDRPWEGDPSRPPLSGAGEAKSASSRMSAITQSMPAFHGSLSAMITRRSTLRTPPNLDQARHCRQPDLSPTLEVDELHRPATAAKPTRLPLHAVNPRNRDNYISDLTSPQIRARLHTFSAELNEPPSDSPAIPILELPTDSVAKTPPSALGRARSGIKVSPRLPVVGERGEAAVSDLMSEVRNIRWAGQPGVESEQLRMARLELQLKALEEQQAEAENTVEEEYVAVQQDIADLQSEITRMKAAQQRKTDAVATLAHLRDMVKEITADVVEAHPKDVSEADLKAIMKQQDLPEWVGNVLSTNCKSSHASAAVAPTPADAGEAVTSRERPLLAETSDAAVEIAGVHDDSITVRGHDEKCACYTPKRHGSNDQEPEEAESRSPIKSHWHGRKSASDRGAGAALSSGRQSIQSNSIGSSCDPDDDIKAIMARALHGMKAQEAVNLKRTMRTMQQKVKKHMEAKLASLQSVLSQYQDAIDEQEEAKNWLVARVLQQENEVAEITEELERAKDECEKQEKLIQSLQNQLEKKTCTAEGTMFNGRTCMDSLTSSWDREPSVEELLTSIVELWSELQVPLRERSQFWLAHQGKDLFYFRAEYGHLLELQRDLEDEPAVLQKRKLVMHRERKWLAMRLKEICTDDEREKLFDRWGITQIKERKKALVLRLWDPTIVQSTAGQKSSAELTLLLYGWDGQDTKLSSLILGLPNQDMKWNIAKQSTRLVGRATSMLAPRTTPPRNSRLSRQSTGMNFDDTSSTMSLPQGSGTLQPA